MIEHEAQRHSLAQQVLQLLRYLKRKRKISAVLLTEGK